MEGFLGYDSTAVLSFKLIKSFRLKAGSTPRRHYQSDTTVICSLEAQGNGLHDVLAQSENMVINYHYQFISTIELDSTNILLLIRNIRDKYLIIGLLS